jgi:hypothetical protein
MTDDDFWIRELAQVNRDNQAEERTGLAERWDRLASGDLSPEEDAELRALAETSDEAREAYEAFRPLGSDFQASVVRAIREQGFAPQTEAAPVEPAGKLLLFQRRAVRFASWSAVAAAAAAAMVVLLVRPGTPLPGYAITEASGVRTSRGEEHEPAKIPVFAPGAFHLVLTPDAGTSGKHLEVRCFLLRGQDGRSLAVQSLIDEAKGGVRMDGSIAPDIPPWTLWAVVGRRGKLPQPSALRNQSSRLVHRDWVAVPKEIQIQPRGTSP